MSEALTSKPESFDIGYPLEEAIADANSWLRGTTMYEGMRGWKAALSVIMADRDRLTARNAELEKAVQKAALDWLALDGQAQELQARNAELVKALEAAIETDGGTSYDSNEDEVGLRACCHELSYRPHSADCWVTTARAALKGDATP